MINLPVNYKDSIMQMKEDDISINKIVSLWTKPSVSNQIWGQKIYKTMKIALSQIAVVKIQKMNAT